MREREGERGRWSEKEREKSLQRIMLSQLSAYKKSVPTYFP
jgi:hypothetical protein